jgi:hypothetical protein
MQCCKLNYEIFKETCRLASCCGINTAGLICWYPGMVLAAILMIPALPFVCMGSFFYAIENEYVDPVCNCLICDYESICHKEEEIDELER